MTPAIRKLVTVVEEVATEMGRTPAAPVRRAAAAAVIANPFAGRYADDLAPLIEAGGILGDLLGRRAVAALGFEGSAVESFGKAAAVGEDGELEHAAALLHPTLGAPLRAVLGGGKALVPSNAKRGGLGLTLDIPLGHKDAAYVRSHFDGMELRIADAPRAGEIVVAVAVSVGGRPLARIGGLAADAITGEDGLR